MACMYDYVNRTCQCDKRCHKGRVFGRRGSATGKIASRTQILPNVFAVHTINNCSAMTAGWAGYSQGTICDDCQPNDERCCITVMRRQLGSIVRGDGLQF